jgi:hypothetical protein
VLLLCYPRLLGYTFNPLSVYFCHRASGELALIIYEVRNTLAISTPMFSPCSAASSVKPVSGSSSKSCFTFLLSFLRAAARHLQDRRGDSLGSPAALAQGRAAGAATECCNGEQHFHSRLGDSRAEPLY